VVGQNITLKFEAEESTTIKKILTKFKMTELIPSKSYELSLGDIQSEEQRDIIVISNLLPLSSESQSQSMAKVTLTYFNVIKSTMETSVINAVIARPTSEPEGQKRNWELDKQYNRILTAEAMKAATDAGNAGNLTEARNIIGAAISRISESVSSSDTFCKGLIEDLKACSNGLKDTVSFSTVGNQMLQNNVNAHFMQRSTNVAFASQQVYQTSARNEMQQRQQKQFK